MKKWYVLFGFLFSIHAYLAFFGSWLLDALATQGDFLVYSAGAAWGTIFYFTGIKIRTKARRDKMIMEDDGL